MQTTLPVLWHVAHSSTRRPAASSRNSSSLWPKQRPHGIRPVPPQYVHGTTGADATVAAGGGEACGTAMASARPAARAGRPAVVETTFASEGGGGSCFSNQDRLASSSRDSVSQAAASPASHCSSSAASSAACSAT